MGNNSTKLTKAEKADLRARTEYSDEDLNQLLKDFNVVARSGTDDGVVDISEFATLLESSPDDENVQRLFSLFDTNKDGFVFLFFFLSHLLFINHLGLFCSTLNVTEFICGLSLLSDKATVEGKLKSLCF